MLVLIWRLSIIASILKLYPAAQLLPNLGYFIEVRQMDCVANPNYVTNFICNVMAPRNRTIDVSLTVAQEIGSLSGTLQVLLPNQRKVFIKIIDQTFNICGTLKERKRKALLDMLVRSLTKGKKISLHCPFPKGDYLTKNITVVESLPPILTETDFLVYFDVFVPKVATVANITVRGSLCENAKEQARKKKYL